MSKELIPSASIILLRESAENNDSFDVLLLQRNPKIDFHGGSWVFPGGKIDPSDYGIPLPKDASIRSHFQTLEEEVQISLAKQAALRELHEEAGLTLAKTDLYFASRWITPEELPKRFDACFFIAACKHDSVKIDQSEIVNFQWISPALALQQHKEGKIRLPPPTFVTLTQLSIFCKITEAIKQVSNTPSYFRPRLLSVDNIIYSLYEDDSAYETGDISQEEQAHRLIMRGRVFQYIKS